MKRAFILIIFSAIIAYLAVYDAFARGGGGGGGGGAKGGGGGVRPAAGGGAAQTPSMSRPAGKPVANRPAEPTAKTNVGGGGSPSRPNVNKPDLAANKPDLGDKRPNVAPAKSDIGDKRPSVSDKKPDLGDKRPSVGPVKPDLSDKRPNVGEKKSDLSDKRPNVGDNRPDLGNSKRPSQEGLQDFLDLPGQSGANERPSLADRPNNGDRPNVDIKKPEIGNKTSDKTKIGDVNINAGNTVAINRQNNVSSIRNKYNNVDRRPFDRDMWGGSRLGDAHWRWQAGWNNYPKYWCWRPCTWAAFGTWFAWAGAQPYSYDYGTTVVYRGNDVYINDKQYATADQYYQQAEVIVESTPQNIDEKKVEWMPLGVYAIAEEDAADTGTMIQLAVSKEGILAGTFFNEVANISRPVEGMVDRKSQRAAWKFADGKNPDLVMETGILNLTKDETTAALHFGAEKTQTWLMVRLPAPEEEK